MTSQNDRSLERALAVHAACTLSASVRAFGARSLDAAHFDYFLIGVVRQTVCSVAGQLAGPGVDGYWRLMNDRCLVDKVPYFSGC